MTERFGGTYRFHLQDQILIQARNTRQSSLHVPLKRRLALNGLCGVTSRVEACYDTSTTALRLSERDAK
jgi:hypothetical protein